jgi:hypothetical protein
MCKKDMFYLTSRSSTFVLKERENNRPLQRKKVILYIMQLI